MKKLPISPKERMRRQRVINSWHRKHPTALQRIQAMNYINGGPVPKEYTVLDKVVR